MVGRALSSGSGNLRAEAGTPKIRGRDLFGGVGFSLVGVATRRGWELKARGGGSCRKGRGPIVWGGDNVIRGGGTLRGGAGSGFAHQPLLVWVGAAFGGSRKQRRPQLQRHGGR